MSTKFTKNHPSSLRHKRSIGAIIFLILLSLVLGLGLGLTRGRDSDDTYGKDTDQPTLTPLPSPSITLPWTPKVNDTWQIILSHPPIISTALIPNVRIFDIDLFDTPSSTIEQLHRLGAKVICYFSAGSYENWRPDANDFKDADLGKNLNGWPGEKWLKLGTANVRGIMKKRIEMAKQKGCDGLDPDNVDGYVCLSTSFYFSRVLAATHARQENDNGLSLTTNDSIAYIQYLSSIARPLNLTLGLKNARTIISAILPLVDFAVNEQCIEYGECSSFQPFIAAAKPVLHIEYPAGDHDLERSGERNGFGADIINKFCEKKGKASEGFSTVLKKLALDGWVQYCDGRVEVTSVDQASGGHEVLNR
jgi:hypothetical protein